MRTLSFAAQALALLAAGFQVQPKPAGKGKGSSSSSPAVFASGAEAALAHVLAAVTAPYLEFQKRYGALEEEHSGRAAEALLHRMASAGRGAPPPLELLASPAASASASAALSDAAAEGAGAASGAASQAISAVSVPSASSASRLSAVERFNAQVDAVCALAPELLTRAHDATRR